MIRIFKYEFRRLITSKTLWGLAIITLIFGWLTLRSDVIMGVANTAPFSAWSYGYYLARMLPFICVVTLFMLTLFSGRSEREKRKLTGATPVNPRKYALTRCAAVALTAVLLSVLVSAEGIAFNAVVFGVSPSAEMLLLPALTIFPALVLALGAGWRLGRIGSFAVYALAALFLLVDIIPLPMWADIMGTAFFSEYPLTLMPIEPPLVIPTGMLALRIVMLGVGSALLALVKR